MPNGRIILMPVAQRIEPGCEEALRVLESRGYTVKRAYGYSAIDAARNQLATDALAEGFDDLLWIDSDILFRPDDADALCAASEPILGGVYPKKNRADFACKFPPGTDAVTFGPAGGIRDVEYVGSGFIRVKRAVYDGMREKLKLPTCNIRYRRPLVPYYMPMIHEEPTGPVYLAEDYAFCKRAQLAGFAVRVDTRIRLRHIGPYGYAVDDVNLPRVPNPESQP